MGKGGVMVDNVLLVCRQKEIARVLTDILRDMEFDTIDVLSSGVEGRRRLQEMDYTLAILNAPLSDEFGTEFAQDILEAYSTSVLLLVRSELVEQVEKQLEDTTAFVVAKPVSRSVLQQNIRFILSSRQKMERLQEENDALMKKMDELKLIYRAKLCIMEYLDMTEPEAHRYIQKHAMDLRKKPAEVARNLIKTYSRG
jgi:AmiR/NasT family two-component response regulator